MKATDDEKKTTKKHQNKNVIPDALPSATLLIVDKRFLYLHYKLASYSTFELFIRCHALIDWFSLPAFCCHSHRRYDGEAHHLSIKMFRTIFKMYFILYFDRKSRVSIPTWASSVRLLDCDVNILFSGGTKKKMQFIWNPNCVYTPKWTRQ